MKAIILVAGYASRLYPLTLNTPKALLKLGDITLLDLLENKLSEIDELTELVLVSNAKYYENFVNWKNEYKGRLKITVLNDGTTSNENRLGAIGDMQFAIEKANINEEAMVLVADNYFDWSLKEYFEFYKEKKASCINVKRFEDKDLEYLGRSFAVVTTDENGQVTHMVEKPGGIPESNLGAFAFYIYTKEAISLVKTYLDEGNNKDAPGNFPSWLHKRLPIYTYEFKGLCYDVGTMEIYNQLSKELAKK